MTNDAQRATPSPDTLKGRVDAYWDKRIAQAPDEYRQAHAQYAEKNNLFYQSLLRVQKIEEGKAALIEEGKVEKAKEKPDKAILDGLDEKYNALSAESPEAREIVDFIRKWKPFIETEDPEIGAVIRHDVTQGAAEYQNFIADKKRQAHAKLEELDVSGKPTALIIGAHWCSYTGEYVPQWQNEVAPQYDDRIDVKVIYESDKNIKPIAGWAELSAALSVPKAGIPQTFFLNNHKIIADPYPGKVDEPPQGKLPGGSIAISEMMPGYIVQYFDMLPSPGAAFYRQPEALKELRAMLPDIESVKQLSVPDRSVSDLVNTMNKATKNGFIADGELNDMRRYAEQYHAERGKREPLDLKVFDVVMKNIDSQLFQMAQRYQPDPGVTPK